MFIASCLPLHLEIGSSRRLMIGLTLIHLGPIPPLFLALPPLPAVSLTLATLFGLWQNWHRYVRRSTTTAVVSLYVTGEKEWILKEASGNRRKATLHHAFVHRLLTLLRFDTRRGRRRVLLLPDAVEENAYHRLQVFLNHLR